MQTMQSIPTFLKLKEKYRVYFKYPDKTHTGDAPEMIIGTYTDSDGLWIAISNDGNPTFWINLESVRVIQQDNP